LRAKLAREGELPVVEVLRILRDVLDALAYAHHQQVVHRDIKPDNVLLSEGHALVTDFGVAKAVAESTGKHTLTSMGVALGTPAYMAPEQATADPHTDHRADIYAVGAMAYEMLSGRPPFAATTAQAMLAAHVTEAPEPVTKHRDTVPDALNQLILRCLAKKPADRWQRADELIPQVSALLTPTGGTTPTGTQPVVSSGTRAAIERAHPVRVAGLFGLASVGVLAIVYAAVQLIGLPDWVFWGAIGLLAIGLPIMVLTGHHERRRAIERSSGRIAATPSGGLTPHFTWSKALLGGGIAFAGLSVVSAGYMALRAFGIGPAGTLITSGALGERERLILADFVNATSDSTLSETVTELLRISLAQSPVLAVLEAGQVGDVLARMQRDRDAAVTPTVAAEVAAREGIKAYVTGELRALGQGYVVSVRLVEAETGAALVAVQEPAADAQQLMPALDRVSARLRERIGESLRSVRASPPLDRLTTTSLQALRRYAQAQRFADQGDLDRAVALLEEAVEQDSMFAMAFRRVGVLYVNRGDAEEGRAALRRAFALRTRSSELERLQIEAMHAWYVEANYEKGITANLAILDKYPTDLYALQNIAALYNILGRDAERNQALRRGIDANAVRSISYGSYLGYLRAAGRLAEADTILALFAERFPDSPEIASRRSQLALARQDLDGAEAEARLLLGAAPGLQEFAHNQLSLLAQMRGQLQVAARERREALRIGAARLDRRAENEMQAEVDGIEQALAHGLGDRSEMAGRLERLWPRHVDALAARGANPPFAAYIPLFGRAGRPARARQLLDEWRGRLSERQQELRGTRFNLRTAEYEILLAEGRLREAAAAYLDACEPYVRENAYCMSPVEVAGAYDRAGDVDSALAYYEGFLALKATRFDADRLWYAQAQRRTGELFEVKGNREKALEYYGRFVELWKNADPELQPVVSEVKQRMARLVGER
ncbi:MAG: protein kinase, partial [Gemmatimonadetes bacterium]|nr:protein kinase [Gemmatimonadota bacterium]